MTNALPHHVRVARALAFAASLAVPACSSEPAATTDAPAPSSSGSSGSPADGSSGSSGTPDDAGNDAVADAAPADAEPADAADGGRPVAGPLTPPEMPASMA